MFQANPVGFESSLWAPIDNVSELHSSGFWIPFLAGSWIPKAGFWIPEPSISDSTSKNFLDSRIRITLDGASYRLQPNRERKIFLALKFLRSA